MKLSIVVPAHNEEENIASVVEQIEAVVTVPHELIVVNDHSSDATPQVVERLMQRYLSLRLVHNTAPGCFANSLKAGFAEVKTGVVVPVMGDLCDDLRTIPQMYAKIEEGYDIVCGCRYSQGGQRLGGSRLKAFLSWFGGWSLYHILGIPTFDLPNAFKMYRKEVIDSVAIESKGFEISMEITLKAYYSGFKITEVPTVWKERTKGKSSFKVFKLLPSYIRLYLWAIRKRIG